jgi:hypothetical protein
MLAMSVTLCAVGYWQISFGTDYISIATNMRLTRACRSVEVRPQVDRLPTVPELALTAVCDSRSPRVE